MKVIKRGYIDPKKLTISPNNVRKTNPRADIESLKISIAQLKEVRNAIVINPQYQVVSGGRRWRAAVELELSKVPYEMREYENEAEEVLDSLLENDLQEPLADKDLELAFIRLHDLGMTFDNIANSTGRSREGVIRRTEESKLPQIVQGSEIEEKVQRSREDMGKKKRKVVDSLTKKKPFTDNVYYTAELYDFVDKGAKLKDLEEISKDVQKGISVDFKEQKKILEEGTKWVSWHCRYREDRATIFIKILKTKKEDRQKALRESMELYIKENKEFSR